MNERGKPAAVLILIPCLAFSLSWLDPFRDQVREGNDHYDRKRYEQADQSYQRAERHAQSDEDSARVAFNRGDAAYGRGDFAAAEDLFSRAASSPDPAMRARALYNRGNARVKAGRYAGALADYRDSLRLDPSNDRARKNIEYLARNMDNGGQGGGRRDDSNGQSGNGGGSDKAGREQSMSPEQRRNIMESMKNKPVRRQGRGDGRRQLEKNW